MEIHFCDLCNESVPQIDLSEGRAFERKGRVICSKCDELMGGGGASSAGSDTKLAGADKTAIPPDSVGAETLGAGTSATVMGERRSTAPPPYRPEGSGSMVAGFMASVALVLVAVVAVILLDRVDTIGEGIDGRLVELNENVAGVERDLGRRITAAEASAMAGASAIEGRLQGLKDDSEDAGRKTAERIDAVGGALDDLRDRVTALTATERAVADQARDLAALDAGLESLRLELARLAEEVAERPVIAAPVLPVAPEPTGPVWLPFLDDLASANSGMRWNAVEDLARTADPEVVPHLIPVLGDEDIFVRMAAARVLGDLGSAEAVGPLIETLSDANSSVRNEAVISLRTLTNQNFRFDPLGKESDRNKRIRAWRDWWEEQQGTA